MKSLESTQSDQNFWDNELLTVSEVAAYLRVGRVTVWRWCKQGHLRASQVGHHWRIHRDDLLRLLDPAPEASEASLFLPLPAAPNGRDSAPGPADKP